MGYCYEWKGGSRLLCCDVCGTSGGVRKVRCPAGYCPAVAMCEACRKDPAKMAELKAYHVEADCAGNSARFDAERAAVAALQAAGEYVFCASSYEDGSDRTQVRCWFRKTDGEPTKVLVVSAALRETFEATTTYASALTAKANAAIVRAAELADSLVQGAPTQDERERVQVAAHRLWSLT
jgi:hypothetical protein